MFCKKCGNILPDYARRCDACGARVERDSEKQSTQKRSYEQWDSGKRTSARREDRNKTYTTYQRKTSFTNPIARPQVNFPEAVKRFYTHYTDFHGRARRSEYWWAMLLLALGNLLLPEMLTWIWVLANLIPSVAVTVRRLHDTGRSGWWYLLNCLPVAGSVVLLVLLCQDSKGPNNWGPSPKYG